MRNTLLLMMTLLTLTATPVLADDFKGKDDPSQFGFGGMAGLGILDNRGGFSLLGTASKKIIDRGFVPDIVNSVWIEAEAGPLFVGGSTAFVYSLHLRWDFVQNEVWTLYALGGAGGAITGAALGDRFELYPRFGAGAI